MQESQDKRYELDITMRKPTTEELLATEIRKSKSGVFLRSEFEATGSYSQVSRAIRQMMKKGTLVRVGYGAYVRARKSSISGKPVPVLPLLKIGLMIMQKLGITADVGKEAQELRSGKSTQVPMLPIISVTNARVSRKIKVGNKTIIYESAQKKADGAKR